MLITGVSGLLGSNLAHYFKDKYDILGLYNSHAVLIDVIYAQKCDITKSYNIKRNIFDFPLHYKWESVIKNDNEEQKTQ